MATPVLGTRGDIVVKVEFDPVGSPGVYTNWCGATDITFSVNNEIISTNVGDCDDWGLPIVVDKKYGPQNVTATIDANWTAATHLETQAWVFDQETKNVQITFPNATTGQVSLYEGAALIAGLELGSIGNTDGNPQTENVSLEFSGAITRTIAP